jgi:hypothetical protein
MDRWYGRRFKFELELRRLVADLADTALENGDWMRVRDALLAAWPTREDIPDRTEDSGAAQVAPVEADVDVPEV